MRIWFQFVFIYLFLKFMSPCYFKLVDAEVQAELDTDMTVACLGPLHLQGLPESYMEVYPKIRRISTVPT